MLKSLFNQLFDLKIDLINYNSGLYIDRKPIILYKHLLDTVWVTSKNYLAVIKFLKLFRKIIVILLIISSNRYV